jgi:hypothetical protein
MERERFVRRGVLCGGIGFAVLFWLSFEPIAGAQIVGSVDTPGWANAVVVDGGYAYIADSDSGLTVVDLSDPADPQVVATVDTPGTALGVDVVDAIAYVADYTGGLRLFDVSNPTAASPLGSTDTPGDARKVVVSGTTAFVADNAGGLTVVDVSSSSSPSVVTSFPLTGIALDVDVSGSMAAVSTGLSERQAGLEIIDITDPAAPALLGRVEVAGLGYGVAATIDGETVYLIRAGYYWFPQDQHYVGLEIVDISSPSEPQLLGGTPLRLPTDTLAHSYGVCVLGSQAICGSGDGGLNFVDAENPSHPFYLGYIPMTAEDVVMDGDYFYIAAREYGLIVVDSAAIPEVPFPTGYAWRVTLLLSLVFSGIAVSRRMYPGGPSSRSAADAPPGRLVQSGDA